MSKYPATGIPNAMCGGKALMLHVSAHLWWCAALLAAMTFPYSPAQGQSAAGASLVSAYVSAAGGAKSLNVGGTLQFAAYGVYADGTVAALPDGETDRVISWNTNNHAIAQISLLGHVTAIRAGRVSIEAAIGAIVATPLALMVTASSPAANGSAGGSTSEGQYNDAGLLAGSPSLLFNPASGTLTDLALTTPGTFGASNYTSYLSAVVSGSSGSAGSCSNLAWYQPITAAVNGCVSAPSPGSGNRNTAGGIFTAFTQDNGAVSYMEPVGVIGQGIALSNGGSVYGANFLAQDKINCCTSGVVLVGQENDVQPTSSSGPAAYLSGTAYRATIGFTNGNTGTYPFDGFELSTNQAGAYWRTGFNSYPGALGPGSVLLNVGAQGTATSASGNFNCSKFANIYETYWNGSANKNEQWDLFCTIGSGPTPSDSFRVANLGGPSGSNHYFDLSGGIQLELDGATSGSTFLSASATGGTLSLGSGNATIDSLGNLTVNSCTGCGVNSNERSNREAAMTTAANANELSATGQGTGSNSELAAATKHFMAGESFVTDTALTTTYVLVSMTTMPERVQPAPPGATNNIGIAQSTSGPNGSVSVISYGRSRVRFDNTPKVGDFACAPPAEGGTAGVGHDNGAIACPAGQKLGVVVGAVSAIGSGAIATVILQLGN